MKLDFTSSAVPEPSTPFEKEVLDFLAEWQEPKTTVEVQTSGSTGTPKVFEVEKKRMRHSAKLTCDFLGLKAGNTALLCLPVKYISGKMMLVRALERQLILHIANTSTTPLTAITQPLDFCALTPLQVENSLDKLHLLKNIIIGGAAVHRNLKEKIKAALERSGSKTRVFETYGMSETLSHIALKQIFPIAEEAFTVFPDIRISTDERGCLVIEAPELNPEMLITNDLVKISENEKRFRFMGRTDNVINSAGLKIFPEQLEDLLRQEISREVIFIGKPDEKLGEKLILVIEGEKTPLIEKQLSEIQYPTKNHRPKEILYLEKVPRLPNGKIDRLSLP